MENMRNRKQIQMDENHEARGTSRVTFPEKLTFPEKQPLSEDELAPILAHGKLQDDFFILKETLDGKKLKNPVEIPLSDLSKLGSLKLAKYILSLAKNRGRLIPFVLRNKSLIRLSDYYLRRQIQSPKTLYLYVDCIHRFSQWARYEPDELINDITRDSTRISTHRDGIIRFLEELQDAGLSTGRIDNYRKAILALYRVNDISLSLPKIRGVEYGSGADAPTIEQVERLMEVADLRGKVIIGFVGGGGIRPYTVCRLKYYHVREDLERNITPLHIFIEKEITKGKYASYDTFVDEVTARYLKLYLDMRRRGSPDGKIPPEEITDDSPLIRDSRSPKPKPVSEKTLAKEFAKLRRLAGMTDKRFNNRYRWSLYSLRKFFRTQLTARGVPIDHIEYMMGHKVSTYNDIRSLGVEYLRNEYARSGFSILPKAVSESEFVKKTILDLCRRFNLSPEEILSELTEKNTAMDDLGYFKVGAIFHVLKKAIVRDLLELLRKAKVAFSSRKVRPAGFEPASWAWRAQVLDQTRPRPHLLLILSKNPLYGCPELFGYYADRQAHNPYWLQIRVLGRVRVLHRGKCGSQDRTRPCVSSRHQHSIGLSRTGNWERIASPDN